MHFSSNSRRTQVPALMTPRCDAVLAMYNATPAVANLLLRGLHWLNNNDEPMAPKVQLHHWNTSHRFSTSGTRVLSLIDNLFRIQSEIIDSLSSLCLSNHFATRLIIWVRSYFITKAYRPLVTRSISKTPSSQTPAQHYNTKQRVSLGLLKTLDAINAHDAIILIRFVKKIFEYVLLLFWIINVSLHPHASFRFASVYPAPLFSMAEIAAPFRPQLAPTSFYLTTWDLFWGRFRNR